MRTVWKITKWALGIGLVVLIVCGGTGAFLWPQVKKFRQAQMDRARGTLVVVEPAARGELTRTVSAPGTVAARTASNISARVSAKIMKIHAEEGQAVKESDVLIELDSLDLIAALDAARARYTSELASLKSAEANALGDEARIAGARAAYTNSVAEFERQQQLFESGDVSQQSLDNARTEVDRTRSTFDAAVRALEVAKANIEAARARAEASKAEVDRAERNVDYCTVRAPFAGVITRRIAQVGETALGTIQNAGTQLMVLEDMSEMLVKARLAETDAPRVSPGQKVRVYINGYPDEAFEGVVRRVGMTSLRWQLDNTLYFEAEIVLDPKGRRLATGTTANVDVEIETIADVLKVPSQAVLDKRVDSLPQKLRDEHPLVDRNKTFARVVMLKKDNKVEFAPVRVIAGNITSTAIAEGLTEGDPVIVGPFTALQQLSDGAMVRTEEEIKAEEKKKQEAAAAQAGKAPADESPTVAEKPKTEDDKSKPASGEADTSKDKQKTKPSTEPPAKAASAR
ncbi:MAG: efflux RND transporter periplasmic adaptor subunit [Planctomycetota bacterium]|nr:efflux RND transporter periplasmic adaptor subunit [Planctomycetota bacterium]